MSPRAQEEETRVSAAGPSRQGRPWDSLPPETEDHDRRSLFQRLRSRIIRLAPPPVVRLLARPYIAGESRANAMKVVRDLYQRRGIHSTVDVLGEAIREPFETQAMLQEYLSLLDDLGRCPHANISIKLSALGQGLDESLCAENLEKLLTRAAALDQFVRFDMEDATTVDSTLAYYREFVPQFPKIGVVLQSRLFRTVQDVERLSSLKPGVRLCIGIYREKPDIAFQEKHAMKARLLELLEMMWEKGQYVGLATHDESVIRKALELAREMGKGPESWEIQMLLGVPRAGIQSELLEAGLKVRLYVPYGRHWYSYCLRRIEHNPEMASLVLRNLFLRR
jgi:proline dehydrogenase